MRSEIVRGLKVVAGAALITAAAGWLQPARSVTAWDAARGLAVISLGDIPAVPTLPKPFAVPAQPIAPADSDGYLPSSWAVTPKGEFTFTLPMAVPPGRAGMAPAISLDYASGSGSGIAGLGWSVSGFSTITRGGRVWAKDGETDGVDFTVRDRFYLDGQELIGVNATPYGGNGAEYRTDPDTFVRVRSSSAKPLDASGPEGFTVELGDGRVRTYDPVVAEQIFFDNDNKVFAHGSLRVEWRITSERDASGNTVSYEYDDFAGPGGANAQDYWYEERPSRILYTANLTDELPTHGTQDLPQRHVKFEYENAPDTQWSWLAGVQRRHSSRLKTIEMYAPNPTATSLVWQYNLSYSPSASQHSLLTSVQRCESAGGCLWAKHFSYSPGAGVLFQSQPIVPAPITQANYDLGVVAAPDGEVPAMQMLDLNGDGASDLLFGPGATQLWEQKYYPAPFYVWESDGKFLGGSHSLWLSKRDASGQIVPLSQGLSLARDEDPLASANYGHVRLDESTAVDLDGDGTDELVAAIDNLGAHELNVDPKLPPLYDCSVADLKWTASGFVHTHAVPCTLLGNTNGNYKYYLPNEFPTFADFNGDGLVDRAWPYNAAGWIGSNNPGDTVQYEFSPAWEIVFNEPGKPGQFGPPATLPDFEASPGVVTDLDGDGRAELTSETLKSSLTFDDKYHWVKQEPDSVHLPLDANSKPLDGYREFGDFNGDGLEDLLRMTRADPLHPGVLTCQIFWNTGKGFYPDSHLRTVPVDVHPDLAKNLSTRFADAGIHVTDVNNDGRMDLVIFNNDHKGANNQPAPQIVFLLSNGDGTFTELDLPVSQPGTRNDVKYWLDNTLRPITFYPDRLENDETRLGLEAYGQVIPGAQILLQLVPFQNYIVVGGDDITPGFASGWNLSTLADVDGDGFIDIVRHVGGNDPAGGFEVLQQTPQWGDELIAVTDEATAWPALSVTYSSEWSDRPEVNDSYQCSYPLKCPKSGLRVVRAVTSRLGLTDLKAGDDPLQLGHTWQYSYRDPIASMQGLGFFGFSEYRVWDTEPSHPVETITTFDLRTPDASGKYYPGVGVPATVTVAQPILQPGQGQPASAPTRITKTAYTYELRMLNGGATHVVLPQSTHTSEWEQSAAIAWSGSGPDHLHVSGYAEPAQPPIHVDAQITTDNYGNVVDTVTQTANGMTTDVSTPTLNDTANWQLGLVSERQVMTLESQKNAIPVWHTTGYTYTDKGQVKTIAVEQGNPDPAIPSTTTLSYDDYGLLASTTTAVASEVPRTQHIEYTNMWLGAPDEHMYASELWAEHDNPLCAGDCRPVAGILTHPAYGVPIAAMNASGVQTVRVYDAHGRLVSTQTDGEQPVSVAYSGRIDAFGGMNGTQITATSGLQQVLQTFNARGAVLRHSFAGFDGQWINTFSTYDELGRLVAISRPNTGAPAAWTTFDHDSLGRDVATTFPDGSSSTTKYSLLKTEHTDAGGHTSYQLFDVDGRLITSGAQLPGAPGCGICLAQDVKSTYQYSATPIGPLDIVLDDQGHATQTQYDRRGRPVTEDEPSRGTTKVIYNGFGEAKQTVQVATGQTETETYDDLGRIITTTTPDGLATYSWDVAVNGVGRLARTMSPDQIKTEYRYDNLGRTTGIDQTDEISLMASIDIQYDPQTGRLKSIDYPKAPGQASRFRAAYDYNGYGYLKTVSDATPNQPAKILQQINARNADLALVDAIRGVDAGAGGGAIADHREYDPLMGRLWTISASHSAANRLNVSYNYDLDGLINQRTTTDETVQIEETFEHDALHRLTHSGRNGMPLPSGLPFSASIDESYDSVGNRIDTMRNGKLAEHRSYGSNGLQPYALTERDIGDPANPNQPPQALTYQYDALGRLQKDPHRSLIWNAFDLPRSVTQDGQTWTFLYGADGERAKKSGPDGTITYLAGLYEKRQSGNGTRHVFHVTGGDGPVADVTYTEAANPSSPGAIDVNYPLTDALGSTDAIADAGGTVMERDHYDSWGLRSNPDGTPLANLSLFQSLSSAGFTDQEHDDDLALINMQGRMYDPALGRFLSPDPVVGSPTFSQSWNSYSYVLNSPLDFTDPSGLDCSSSTSVSDGGKTVSTLTGCHEGSGSLGGNAGSDAESALIGAFAFIREKAELAQQQHELDVKTGRALPDGTRIRTADGTPILPHRFNSQNQEVDNWGRVLYPHGPVRNPKLNTTNNPVVKYAGNFAVRLFCGSKCAEASAPTSAREAAAAPKQLSNAQIARNAVSQALAARALVKFLGKVGVVIDEGVDGIVDRLTPDGMGMDDYEKKVLQRLAEKRAERARLIEEALAQFNDALKRYEAATAMRDRRLEQATAAAADLDAIDSSTVGTDLIEAVYSRNLAAYGEAEGEVGRAGARLQFADDWLQALRAGEE